jgi:Tfp pilus assembly protein PilF
MTTYSVTLKKVKSMMKFVYVLIALSFMFLSVPAFAADDALKFPMREGSSASAHKHNEEGISHFNQGHYDVALKHFQMASSIDPAVGESHYNEALCLDKLGRHGDATNHFYAARKHAHGNPAILNSGILNAHAPMKREGS